MMVQLGKFSGLQISARPSALAGTLLLWALFSVATLWIFRIPVAASLLAGLIASGLHWISELFHQLGHAWAARRTGYPMVGIQLWGLLSTSLYPSGEPPLPASIHIRRALGGPSASFLLALIGAIIAVILFPMGGIARLLAVFFFLENLLVFTLGAFIPLGFNDGSTLLTWWGKR